MQPNTDRPPIATPTQPNFDFTIESPRRSPVPRAVDEIKFHLTDIQITGAVTLSADRFRPLYQDLIGKDVTLSNILDVADSIEADYRRAGYLLVRAFVPPQRVGNGVFSIDIVEGYVANVSIDGGDEATQARIRSYLTPVLNSKPLTQVVMERALLLANDLPGIAASGLLRASPDTPGASDLVVTVTEAPVNGGVAIDNRGSHFTGLWTLTGDFALNGLLNNGDQLSGSVALAPDFNSWERVATQARYRRPIGDDGLVASVFGTYSHGQPVSSLSALEILTNSWAVGGRLSYPLMRTRAESVMLDGGVTFQEARLTALHTPASTDTWRVADIALSYLETGFLGGSWITSADLAQGLPILGASPNSSPHLLQGGHTDFTKLTGSAHYLRPLFDSFSLALAAQAQYSFQPLVAGEKLTFGGTQLGRGYEPGAELGDRGLGGSVEIRYDARIEKPPVRQLEPYVFYDGGHVWNVHNDGQKDQAVQSIGGGIRFWAIYNITGTVEVAHTLDAVPGSDNNHKVTKALMEAAIRF